MISFLLQILIRQHLMLLFGFWVNERAINMAEEFKRYKDILAREQKEFREEMGREVSAFLPFQLDREKWDLNWV